MSGVRFGPKLFGTFNLLWPILVTFRHSNSKGNVQLWELATVAMGQLSQVAVLKWWSGRLNDWFMAFQFSVR